jgi:hypothetical protein
VSRLEAPIFKSGSPTTWTINAEISRDAGHCECFFFCLFLDLYTLKGYFKRAECKALGSIVTPIP